MTAFLDLLLSSLYPGVHVFERRREVVPMSRTSKVLATRASTSSKSLSSPLPFTHLKRMDSPNASGYVPLSLVDTLSKPTRSYRSIQSTPSLSSSRSIHHAHSSSLAALASKERSEQARREAAAISESLGLSSSFEKSVPETPIRRGGGGTSSFNHGDVEATPKPFQSYPSQASEIATLKAQLSERDQELAAFKREVGILRRDKKELVQKCEKLELDTAKGAARGGLDAVQVEELVKQFNDQEALLGEPPVLLLRGVSTRIGNTQPRLCPIQVDIRGKQRRV